MCNLLLFSILLINMFFIILFSLRSTNLRYFEDQCLVVWFPISIQINLNFIWICILFSFSLIWIRVFRNNVDIFFILWVFGCLWLNYRCICLFLISILISIWCRMKCAIWPWGWFKYDLTRYSLSFCCLRCIWCESYKRSISILIVLNLNFLIIFLFFVHSFRFDDISIEKKTNNQNESNRSNTNTNY